jgi:hypothetical protein
MRLSKPEVKLRLAVETEAEPQNGFDDGVQRAVRENCDVKKSLIRELTTPQDWATCVDIPVNRQLSFNIPLARPSLEVSPAPARRRHRLMSNSCNTAFERTVSGRP